ncbi:hypothetical protein K7H91_17775 [Martelella mediterranea]|uniref:hypothetical protein n=1 Tax=Martelella mediterranea TaxID=293089 RepID=UPI001E579F49|nr:hypothetical protein [Martelella mediterranea]MCD1635619.1 hypothetical protein [Martelella mediterranea]
MIKRVRIKRVSGTMGKSIAVLFAGAALMIMAASLAAPGSIAAGKPGCAPAYGVDPCALAAVN